MRRIILLSLVLFVFMGKGVYAGVTVTWDGTTTSSIQTVLDQYTSGANKFFRGMADAFTTANVVQPNFGEPYRNFVIGGSLGVAVAKPPEGENAGNKGFSKFDFGAGLTLAPFITISLEPLAESITSYFKDSDLTIKILPLSFGDKNKTYAKFLTLGLIFRKKIGNKRNWLKPLFTYAGLGYSVGLFYNQNEITAKFNINQTETISTGLGDAYFAITNGNFNVDTKSLSLDVEIKPYFNALWILDVFVGLGCSVNLVSKFSVSGNLNGQLNTTNLGGGTETSSMRVVAEEKGHVVVPRIIIGIQFNILMIKIPIQYSKSYSEDSEIHALTFGLAFSF